MSSEHILAVPIIKITFTASYHVTKPLTHVTWFNLNLNVMTEIRNYKIVHVLANPYTLGTGVQELLYPKNFKLNWTTLLAKLDWHLRHLCCFCVQLFIQFATKVIGHLFLARTHTNHPAVYPRSNYTREKTKITLWCSM